MIYYCFLLHLVNINEVIFSLKIVKIVLNKLRHSPTVFLGTMKFNYDSTAESLSEIPIYSK